MSRNLPYTIQTLAIELNRSEEQIKLAIDILLELEMIELIDGRIYRVKNFAKHQNIKVEEKVKYEAKEEVNEINIDADDKAVMANTICDEEENLDRADEQKDKESENNVVQNESSNIINQHKRKVDINDIGINKGNNLNTEISGDTSKNNITIPFEKKKNKKSEAKKKQEEVVNFSAMVIGLLSIGVFFVPLCIEYTSTFIIMAVICLLVTHMEHKGEEKLLPIFFISGMLTCFFDFLTTETISFTMPLVIALCLRYKPAVTLINSSKKNKSKRNKVNQEAKHEVNQDSNLETGQVLETNGFEGKKL